MMIQRCDGRYRPEMQSGKFVLGPTILFLVLVEHSDDRICHALELVLIDRGQGSAYSDEENS